MNNSVFEAALKRVLKISSWVIGTIIAAIVGFVIGTFAVIGLAIGSWNPLVGFVVSTCGSITVLPLILGLGVGWIHNKVRSLPIISALLSPTD